MNYIQVRQERRLTYYHPHPRPFKSDWSPYLPEYHLGFECNFDIQIGPDEDDVDGPHDFFGTFLAENHMEFFNLHYNYLENPDIDKSNYILRLPYYLELFLLHNRDFFHLELLRNDFYHKIFLTRHPGFSIEPYFQDRFNQLDQLPVTLFLHQLEVSLIDRAIQRLFVPTFELHFLSYQPCDCVHVFRSFSYEPFQVDPSILPLSTQYQHY